MSGGGGQRYTSGLVNADDHKPKQFGLLEVGQLVGLLAGLTTLVYVSGAAVLWTRLSHKHLPPEAVIPSLPRQLPISIGLTEVVVPLLVAGSILTTAIFVVVKKTDIESLGRALDGWSAASLVEQRLLMAVMIAALAGGELLAWLVGHGNPLAVFLGFVTWAVFWSVAWAIRKHFTGRLDSFAAVLATGSLFVFSLTPWLVANAQRRHPLVQVTVCLTDGPPLTASLISEAGDRIYVGVSAEQAPARPTAAGSSAGTRGPAIAVLPRSRVQALLIGGSFACTGVAKPPTAAPTS